MKNNGLRAFVRYNQQGHVVPSALITQRSIPKDGTWREIPFSLCCKGSTELRFTQDDSDLVCPFFTLYCGETPIFQSSDNICNIQTPTLQDQINWLNTYFGSMGEFSLSGSEIVFKIKNSIINDLCPEGVVGFTVHDND